VTEEINQKVKATHLKRNAYLYIRQSTPRQVIENTESTKRQYALRQRAVALGWPEDRIIVIDNDLGQSGASAADREGFQRLVTEVSLGRAGIVLGLEVSRLARNSTDWHRLLEICALADALILDEDGVYDPAHFNDRLLLGLKGTMSEAELHVLRARLRGGILNKARRGELSIRPPIGFVYNPDAVLTLDPDQQVQHSLRLLFETYRRTGSASATVKTFHDQALLFPRRVSGGPQKGDLVWGPLGHCQTLRILHNPRYAGLLYSADITFAKPPMVVLRSSRWHSRSGTPSSQLHIRAICPGKSMNRINDVYAKTRRLMEPTDVGVPPARDRRYFKDCSSAGAVACA